MFSQDGDGQQSFALGLVFTVAALAVVLVLGIGVSKGRMASPASIGAAFVPVSAPVIPTPAQPVQPLLPLQAAASAPTPDTPPATQSGVTVESGTVRFYFASGSASLAAGAEAALSGVIAEARNGRTVVLSGFHDASGNLAANAALARKRAAAVRDALLRAGVPAGRILMQKPVQMEAGSDAEARRVDITVQ